MVMMMPRFVSLSLLVPFLLRLEIGKLQMTQQKE